jgi:hypothetical protein
MPEQVIRIAMWSGPRNISTAMMRAFGNRPDCFVTDEPLYAHYLRHTGLPHPGAAQTMASQENDWRKVVAWLTGPVPGGRRVWYQKHMTHHLLPMIERGWLDQLCNCFLIREPREMVTSLIEFIPRPVLTDTGLPQQLELFERERQRLGKTPPVVDARDVLENPRDVLAKLCSAVGLEFTDAMLSWPPGLRETDGVWAKYWYDKVAKTTGFGPYKAKDVEMPAELEPLLVECEAIYARLREHRITA